MKITEEHIEALQLLDQMRRDKFSASRFEVLKEAVGILQKQQGIQWNKYPETKPKNVGDCLVLHKEEGLCVIWATPQDAFGLEGLRITHWAEINLPNQ